MTENKGSKTEHSKQVDKDLLNRLADQYIDMSRAQLRLLLNDPEQIALMARVLRQGQQNFMDLFNLAQTSMGGQNGLMPFGFGMPPTAQNPVNENTTETARDTHAQTGQHTTAANQERPATGDVSPEQSQSGLSVLADRIEQLEKRLAELETPPAKPRTKAD